MLCFPTIASTNMSPNEAADLFRLILRAVIVIVFLGMNILYQLFWKKNAKADYFESRGITELPPDRTDFIAVQPTDFAPRALHRYLCRCGFDLQSDPQHCLDKISEDLVRCPKCAREFILDDLPVPAVAQFKFEHAQKISLQNPEEQQDIQQPEANQDLPKSSASPIEAIEAIEDIPSPFAYQPPIFEPTAELVVGAVP